MSSNFEAILEEHPTLHKLIKEKDLNTFTKFPSFDAFDASFIDWLSPQYYDTFLDIYNTHIGQKTEAKVVKLVNSTWFCNEDTKTKIISFLSPHLDATLELSEKLRQKISGNKNLEDIIKVSGLLVSKILNYVNKAIFEKNLPEITSKKDKIIDNCLSVCEELKQYKASSEIEFSMFNGILDRLKSIKLNPTQQARYDACVAKSKSSSNKYIIVTVIIVIIALIRIVARLAN